MDPIGTIQSFLTRIGSRLRRRDALLSSIYVVVFLISLSLLSPLLANWADLDRSSSWIFLVIAALGLIGGAMVGWLLPKRRWAKPEDSARYVGEHVSSIRSNLLSSIEFIDAQSSGGHVSGSAGLREALFADTAQRIEPLQIETIVSYSTLSRAMKIAVGVAGLYLATSFLAPNALAMGWGRLLHPAEQAPFDGAQLEETPLVGDMDVIVEFPLYTRKPNLNLPSSSGDFEAMPGSTIWISTRATGAVERARILLANTDELESDEELELSSTDGVLEGHFEVRNETYYRFEIDDGDSRRVEARARHIGIQNDKAPTVEFYAPADELDIAKVKRLELAYTATDDFGIDRVELVFKELGGKEVRQRLDAVKDGQAQPQRAQAKYIWDLAELSLSPGVKIEYHLEITDNDNVLGPNITKSRSFSLRLYSPRERHEELMARQEQVAQHMLALLAERLTVGDLQSINGVLQLEDRLNIQRVASEIVVELGSLVAAFKNDELAQKALAKTFGLLRDRMNKRTRREEKLFSELSPGKYKGTEASAIKRVLESNSKTIEELEADVLTISDWLHRQEIENLLSISDEIKTSQERLDTLFEEYKRTGSKELLAEIEREVRKLEKLLQDRTSQSRSMPEDVLDRFVNAEAMQQEHEKNCLEKVKELLAAGDVDEAQLQMVKCSEQLDESADALEKSLESLRSVSFSAEEKQFQEAMDQLADLAQDQADIADKTDKIYERYAKAVSELTKEQGPEVQKKTSETLAKLRKKLKEVPKRGLSSFAKEELEILNERVEDTENMLKRGELAEALSMARYIKRSLRTINNELEFTLDENWSRDAVVAEKSTREAMPLAKRLVEELQNATPSPSEIMSKDDIRKLDKLKRQQKSVQSRSEKLQKKAEEQGKSMPGKAGKELQDGLAKAVKHMDQATKQMRARDPSSARQEARSAAKRLNQTKKAAQGAARKKQKQGRVSSVDQPIRIPGAEDYKAPEEFREEILDAMKEDSAPSGFSDQVKRYYKEIMQ